MIFTKYNQARHETSNCFKHQKQQSQNKTSSVSQSYLLHTKCQFCLLPSDVSTRGTHVQYFINVNIIYMGRNFWSKLNFLT
jgi:hypothetical protein